MSKEIEKKIEEIMDSIPTDENGDLDLENMNRVRVEIRTALESIRTATIEEIKGVVDEELRKSLNEFANTPIHDRKNGWNWILVIRDKLKSSLASLSQGKKI